MICILVWWRTWLDVKQVASLIFGEIKTMFLTLSQDLEKRQFLSKLTLRVVKSKNRCNIVMLTPGPCPPCKCFAFGNCYDMGLGLNLNFDFDIDSRCFSAKPTGIQLDHSAEEAKMNDKKLHSSLRTGPFASVPLSGGDDINSIKIHGLLFLSVQVTLER